MAEKDINVLGFHLFNCLLFHLIFCGIILSGTFEGISDETSHIKVNGEMNRGCVSPVFSVQVPKFD